MTLVIGWFGGRVMYTRTYSNTSFFRTHFIGNYFTSQKTHSLGTWCSLPAHRNHAHVTIVAYALVRQELP